MLPDTMSSVVPDAVGRAFLSVPGLGSGEGGWAVRKLPPPPLLPSRPKIGRFPDEQRATPPPPAVAPLNGPAAPLSPPAIDPGPIYSDLDPAKPRRG
jgi:hypothetical protein